MARSRLWLLSTLLFFLLLPVTADSQLSTTIPLRADCTTLTNVTANTTLCKDTTRGVVMGYDGTGWQSDAARATSVINVTDPRWGAKADGGVTDNATPFMNALAAAGVGGKVNVPCGTNFYGFATTFTVSNLRNVTLEGAGDCSMLVNTQTGGQNLITITGSQGFTIRRVALAGHGSSGHGIYVTGGSHRWLIEDVFCMRVGGDCLRVNSGFGGTLIHPRFSTSVYASGVIGPFPYAGATDTADNGVVLEASATTGSQTIVGPIIEGMANWGIDIGANSLNTVILGGTVEGQNVGNIRTGGLNTMILGVNVEVGGSTSAITVSDGARGVVIDGAQGAGSGTVGLIQIGAASDTVLRNLITDNITIAAGAKRTRLLNVSYGNNGGGVVDNGTETIIEGVSNSSNENQQVRGRKSNSHTNQVRNGGFERWLSSTSMDAPIYGSYSVSGATLVRSGDGESDTTKFAGHYAAKVTETAGTGAGFFISGASAENSQPGPVYANIAGKTLTVSVWAKAASGTPGLSLRVFYNSGTATSSQSFTTSTTWTKYSASFPVLSGHTYFDVRFQITTASAVMYFDSYTLTLGDAEPYGEADNAKVVEPEPIGYHTVTFSATPTFYHDASSVQVMTLTANVTSVTFANGVPGVPLTIIFVQDGTGSRTVAGWAGTIKLAGGAYTATTTASQRDALTFVWDGTNWWEIARSMNL